MKPEAAVYARARSIEDALALKGEFGPGSLFCGGLTVLQLGWSGGRPDRPVIDISNADFGPAVEVMASGGLRFAANARLEALRRHPLVRARLPALADLLALVGASGVRTLATLGGNLAWGRGDVEVLTVALNARLVHDRDLLVAIEVPPVAPEDVFVEKVGHRESFSPALAVVAGCRVGGGWRLAARPGPTPVRAAEIAGAVGAAEVAGMLGTGGGQATRVAARLLLGHAARLGAAA